MTGRKFPLPDKSIVWLDDDSLRFRSVEPLAAGNAGEIAPRQPSEKLKISAEDLSARIRAPKYRFADGFRRVSDHPRYSVKWSVEIFEVARFARGYGYTERARGTMFAPLYREWHFLDGGIIERNGYGWASPSWTVVQGAEALRAMCLLLGIQQPRLIRGEPSRRALSVILEDLTNAPVQPRLEDSRPDALGDYFVKYGEGMSDWTRNARRVHGVQNEA